LTGKSIQFITTMQPPDWSRCTEEQLWRYVAWHLEGEGIRSVLVGGAVVAIYTEGLYRSGDLDMVPDDSRRQCRDSLFQNGSSSDQGLSFLTFHSSTRLLAGFDDSKVIDFQSWGQLAGNPGRVAAEWRHERISQDPDGEGDRAPIEGASGDG
jgi:hypothetical protein